ncbi:UDP-2,4-diacetamido-2,4,6-trideoxy-beta-L-altropyranose hydrolase [Bradyrhizobium sp. 190]|uniref:UDP-2,4-diacetamido-2,4, 6-trideoxy-beta-L-altropyranose hydrolase n=1 Tax=Bradyrhizobium sp. 190 TaxID=2782658 RepID=UPI001FF9EF9D|nr:UDP-2,4-diacetamido-2,4,6-trideoxy-beta-L-altropyranose hydrolase [Bradyrhizobium sp. 190]
MRCLSLARALADDGANVFFLLRSHAAGLTRLIEGEGHSVRLLPDPDRLPDALAADGTAHVHWLPTTWQKDAEQTLEAIDRIGPVDWLIVDHYALDARWERMQRKRAPCILAIDDLADRNHDCDILLDQNLVLEMERRYRGLLPKTCKLLLGPRYALLRPEFAEQRKSLGGRSGKVSRIFVCYGGSDPSNETAKALAAIKRLSGNPLPVDVVVGLSNPHGSSVATMCEELPGAVLHRGADNIADLMGRADLAIGAGGVMCWERCCLGLPTLAVDIAPNQLDVLTALAAAGALVYLGSAASVTEDQMARSLEALLRDPARIRALGKGALALVDGEGLRRVCAELEAFRPRSAQF